jgi:hypothetical protein
MLSPLLLLLLIFDSISDMPRRLTGHVALKVASRDLWLVLQTRVNLQQAG